MLINVCTVKGDKKVLKEIKQLHDANPKGKIIVGGCVTKEMILKIEQIIPNASIINTDNITKIIDVVNSDVPIRLIDRKKEIKVMLPRIRNNDVISIIPISQGCTSACTYCSTKLIKGNIFSYLLEKIILEIKQSVNEGCKEIYLTSQDNSDYGFDWDKKCHLPRLINKITELEGDFWIRVGMMNPIGIMPILDELIEAYKSEKVYKFIHVPIQAGSNTVLKKMARRYKVEDFKMMVQKFRKEIPDITVSTDIIVGFPNESEEDFEKTLEIVKEIKFDVINIARFVPREGTFAYSMQNQILENSKKERSTKLTTLFREISLEKNKKWIGWQGKMIINEKLKDGKFIGRNYAYKPIILLSKNKKLKFGDIIQVKIVDASKFVLKAEIIKN